MADILVQWLKDLPYTIACTWHCWDTSGQTTEWGHSPTTSRQAVQRLKSSQAPLGSPHRHSPSHQGTRIIHPPAQRHWPLQPESLSEEASPPATSTGGRHQKQKTYNPKQRLDPTLGSAGPWPGLIAGKYNLQDTQLQAYTQLCQEPNIHLLPIPVIWEGSGIPGPRSQTLGTLPASKPVLTPDTLWLWDPNSAHQWTSIIRWPPRILQSATS